MGLSPVAKNIESGNIDGNITLEMPCEIPREQAAKLTVVTNVLEYMTFCRRSQWSGCGRGIVRAIGSGSAGSVFHLRPDLTGSGSEIVY